jgi:amino acid permease
MSLVLIFNTRWSLRISNAIGLVKLLTLIFISITGLVVLGGHTRVKNPTANFHNAFEGTSGATAYGATNAMYKIIFSYAGYENAFNVVNEVKVCSHSWKPLLYQNADARLEPNKDAQVECALGFTRYYYFVHPSKYCILRSVH